MSTEEESSKSNNGIHDENSFEPKETKLASQGKENFIEINSTEPLKQGFLAICKLEFESQLRVEKSSKTI